jgi:hypothetical protein
MRVCPKGAEVTEDYTRRVIRLGVDIPGGWLSVGQTVAENRLLQLIRSIAPKWEESRHPKVFGQGKLAGAAKDLTRCQRLEEWDKSLASKQML